MGSSQSKKIPNDLRNASVSVALQKTCYNSGERVLGYVDITITNGHVKCSQIIFEMKAETHTTVHYTKTHGVGKNRRTSHHTARETVQNYCLRVVGCQFPSGRAEIGHYQVPFEFIVPESASSTVVVPLIGRNSASLTHMIDVGIEVKGRTHYVHSVPFQVIGRVNHPINETMIEDRQDVNFCCCCGRGELVLGAHLNKNAYAAGENASVTYEVNNASKSRVERIDVQLIGTVRASAKGYSFVRDNVIASTTCNAVEPGEGFGSRRREGGPAKNFMLQVPSNCPYPSTTVTNLSTTYKFRLCCQTACCVTNPSVELPVTLYQQPLEQAVMVQGYNTAIENPSDQVYPLLTASVNYAPDSHALRGTLPPAHMRVPVAVPVDTTGDGIANAIGYDTTGDGKIDALDTTGDGMINMHIPPSNSTSPMAQATYINGPTPVPVDTTGDGKPNAWGYDTTCDGIIDSLDTNNDGKIDMTLKEQPPPPYSQTDNNNHNSNSIYPHSDPNGYGSSYANSYGDKSQYTSMNSVPPSSQNMYR